MTLPHITKKQEEILLLLYKFRFLHRIHIQKLLNHKDYKNINAWLRDLTEKNYTVRIQEKPQLGMKPAKYYISKNGIKFLKTQPTSEKTYLTKLYQEIRRTPQFIEKCLLIADIYLVLREQIQNSSITFKFYTQSDFPKNGAIRDIQPTFAYIKETEQNIENFLCEVIESDMPWYAVSGRIKKYFEFYADEEDGFMNIIFICPDDRTYVSVGRFTRKLIEENDIENLRIYTTTYERMRKADFELVRQKD